MFFQTVKKLTLQKTNKPSVKKVFHKKTSFDAFFFENSGRVKSCANNGWKYIVFFFLHLILFNKNTFLKCIMVSYNIIRLPQLSIQSYLESFLHFSNIQVLKIICFRFHKSRHSSVRHDRMRSQQIWKAVKASKYGQLECLCRTFFYAFEELERKD